MSGFRAECIFFFVEGLDVNSNRQITVKKASFTEDPSNERHWNFLQKHGLVPKARKKEMHDGVQTLLLKMQR